MSTVGQYVGVAAGIVIGFYTGGAGWALVGSIMMGAAAGYAVGSVIDPVAPDMPSPGESALGELDIALADEGVIVADGLGTFKAIGEVFFYGGNTVQDTYEEVEGGKGGGSQSVKTGSIYYLSWCQGICLGPVDALISIFRNDNPVWQGNVKREDAVDGYTSITIPNMGTMHFYFGGTDHAVNSALGSLITQETSQTYNPPHKGLCYAFFDNVQIGNYNRCPTMKFVVRKSPTYSWNEFNRIGLYDYNPSHAIYYIIDKATELPSSYLDENSFSDVADTLVNAELGISAYMGREEQAMSLLENLITHIGGILQFKPDGKFHLSLMRDDVLTTAMDSYDDDDFVEDPIINRNTWDVAINDVKVQYAKRVDRPLEGVSQDAEGIPDVFTMVFIDEATWWSGYGYTDNGSATSWFTTDVLDYFTNIAGGEAYRLDKEWLRDGAAHISVCLHVTDTASTGDIVPTLYDASYYCDLAYDISLSGIGGWAGSLNKWQSIFMAMVGANGKGDYVPGSTLRVIVDTSSLGGISALDPAYSQFKSWVTTTYGGLQYMEYTDDKERWIKYLHEDLTPWGYVGDV